MKDRDKTKEQLIDELGKLRQRTTELEASETARRQAEETLPENEQNFRNSMDNSPLGIIILGDRRKPPDDERGEIIYANGTILDIYGFNSTEELKSAPLAERYTSRTVMEVAERLKQRDIGSPMPTYYEVDIIRTDGGIRHLEVSTEEVVWNGQLRVQLIYQDITERKLVEAEREQLIKQLQEALENVNILRGLLPICAWCKKLRDDQGYWKSVEEYISAYTGAEFTHGVCPDCQAKLLDQGEIEEV